MNSEPEPSVMGPTVLVPTDGSAAAERALEFAASEYPDGELVVYHAINPVVLAQGARTEALRPEFWSEWMAEASERSDTVIEAAKSHLEPTDVDTRYEAELGPPADRIINVTQDRDIDRVVIGSHGRTGITRVVLGSVVQKVVGRVSVPVTVVHPDEE